VPDDLVDPVVGLFADLGRARGEDWAYAVRDVLDTVDAASAPEDRRFVPAPLDPDRVELPDGEPVPDLPDRVGVVGVSEHDVDGWRRLSGLGERTCVEDAVAWTRAFADGGCWSLGACRDASSTSAGSTAAGAFAIAELWSRIDLDERSLWVRRAWGDHAGTGLLVALDAWTEDAEDSGRTRWIEARWSAGGPAPAGLAESVDRARALAEAFLDAGRVSCAPSDG
jgi:hypothetical protein